MFPTPDFSQVKPGDKIPKQVQEALKEEKKKVDSAYSEFSKRIDTSALLKKIEEAEKIRLGLLTSTPAPTTHKPTSTSRTPNIFQIENSAVKELEKMFEDLGRNFRNFLQG